jgi:butyrate kinase
LYDDEDKRKDGVCGEVFVIEPGQVRTCIAEHEDEKQPNERDVNHNLDEETAQERPDGRIHLSFLWNLAHVHLST